MQKIAYLGFPNCLKLSNESVELIVTTDVGPRIVGYALHGHENMLAVRPDIVMNTPNGDWRPYGGHRLWAAPESMPETYYPDNDPIEYEELGKRAVLLRAPVERGTDLQKQMRVTLHDTSSEVTIEHTITNHGHRKELAPWALTIMTGGGVTMLPQEPYRSHDEYLLPVRSMALWGFTDLTDPRLTIGRRLIQLRTDELRDHPQKIGILNKQAWAAYLLHGTLFIKRSAYIGGATYPDLNSNTEAYTAGLFMELETLGPLVTLDTGESTTHTERWTLHSEVLHHKNEGMMESEIVRRLGRA